MSLIRRNSDRAWGTCVSPPEATRRSFAEVFARSAKIFFWTINRTFSKPKILAAGLKALQKKKKKKKMRTSSRDEMSNLKENKD